MYDAFKEIREEGINIGRAEGIGIGIARNNEENITRMLEMNVLPDTIAKYLGISEEEVRQVMKEYGWLFDESWIKRECHKDVPFCYY